MGLISVKRPAVASARAASDSSPTIQASLNRVLDQEARANELKLAYVRAVVLLISTALDILVFFFPKLLLGQDRVPPTIALISLVACTFAVLLIKILRQKQATLSLRQLQELIPVFDSLLLGAFITNIWHVFGQKEPLIITNITALCCLLAVTGGMRLNQRSPMITTMLALVNFTYAAMLFNLTPTIGFFAGFTIFGTGFWAMWMAHIVRRQVKNEIGRVLMERFLPKTVVEAAFESPLALLQAPRICEVTIVITDLRNFTQFSEKLEPQAVLDFLNQYQGLLARIVEQHGGWVDKFMGDGMLAVFGAPEPLANHADRALQAAITMVKEMKAVSPLAMGVGLHSGSVVAGCLGMDSHLEFTVIGDTVNVASRIEAMTKQVGRSLLLSQTTHQSLEKSQKQWPLESLGHFPLRGRTETIELFSCSSFEF